jgi:hypothetical protein
LAIEALVERVLGDQALELGNELGVAPIREIRVETILLRREPHLLEPARCLLCERFVANISEWLTTPEIERLTQQPGITGCPSALCQVLEPLQVQLTRLDPQDVTRRTREKPVVAKCLPQLGDRVLKDLGRRRRGSLAPELVDEPVARDELVRV